MADLADQVRAAGCDDDLLVAKVRAAARLAGDRSIEARSNNRFPHWSLERWLLVLGAIGGTIGFVFGGIFFLGGKWQRVEDAMEAIPSVQMQIKGVQQTLEQINQRLIRTEEKVQAIAPDDPPPPPRRRTPVFAPEWSIGGGS